MPSWRRTLAIMVAVQFSSAMGFSIIFPFLPLYVTQLDSTTGWSTETLAGLVFSVQALTMAIASPFWGVVADRFGRKLMVMRATLGGAVVIVLMGFVANVEQLLILRAVQGLLTGVITAANALVASVAPRERTGYAMGLLQVGLWSGVSTGPLVGGILSDVFGFRITFVVTSAALLVSGVSVWLGVHDPFVRTKDARLATLHFLQDWERVLSNVRLDCALGLRFLVATGRAIMEPLLPLFVAVLAAQSARVGTLTGVVVGAASAASILTSVWLGRLGDRIGHGRVVFWCAVVAAASYAPQALATRVWQLLWLQVLTGASAGGLITSLSALLARESRSGDEGCVYGIDNSITSLGRTVAPLLGAACAVWFSLRGAFLATSLIFVAVAIVAGLTVRRLAPTERR
ncbi:MAG: MFS transporter [Zetaproteobacteria bacterium]|nr:MAG: MFS transporter [Zetaproteobacteria bacterium]